MVTITEEKQYYVYYYNVLTRKLSKPIITSTPKDEPDTKNGSIKMVFESIEQAHRMLN